jgi:Ca2+-transporting ATPase
MVLNSDVSEKKTDGMAIQRSRIGYALNKNSNKGTRKRISKSSRVSIRFFKKMHDNATHQTEKYLLLKGLLCTLDKITTNQQPLIAEFDRKANDLANEGLSGYWLCHKRNTTLPETLNIEEIESSLTFIGFAGMIDPRNEAKKQFQNVYKPEYL